MTVKTTRKSSGTYRDKKGRTPVRVGPRGRDKVFMFGKNWSLDEVDKARIQLKEVFEFFQEWNTPANDIATSLKNKINPVPVPAPDVYQPSEESLIRWHQQLASRMPSIPFEPLAFNQVEILQQRAMKNLQISADKLAAIDNRPIGKVIASAGTLHSALKKYQDYVLQDQPKSFDRHSKIKQLIERSKNIPLATLDIEQCRILIDYWRARPPRHDAKGKYSAKRSREQLAELDTFFIHTHTNNDFAWRMPDDLPLLNRTINKDDKKTLKSIAIKLFEVEELKALVSTGSLLQKLIATWCLNCSHGAAEIGRVEWGDLYLNQDHPWRSQGLKIEPGGNWIGFLRPKSDVIGWWQLWDETVSLIEEWRIESEKILGRKIQNNDRLIITKSGSPMYKDESINGQSKFATDFLKHRTIANVQKLPFGTLRNQLSDWITTTQGNAIVASVALAHGIPHKDDRLLFAHYSNKPWKQLFEYQMMFREVFFSKPQE